MRRLVAACITATVLTGCGSVGADDPLQVTDTLTAAEPAHAPRAATTPAGNVRPAPPTTLTTHLPGILATVHERTVSLYDTRDLNRPPRTLELPGTPATLRATPDGHLLAPQPDADLVARIDPATATAEQLRYPGGPLDATPVPGGLAVALRADNTIALPGGARATGFQRPAELLTLNGEVHVLDTLTTSLTPIDITTGDKQPALRAGTGATRTTADRYGRVLAVDTRGEELLAFDTKPLIMKQRYPVPGAPYGLAYDPARDLAWITLTATNELVGYDIAGGEPREVHRMPTVEQPDSVTVDPDTGRVYVASATGAGLQVVTP
ncbi:YncE family protein [Saccharopolyspora sp. NPDC002578]